MSDVFSILKIEKKKLKNLGDNFFQLDIISVDLKSNFNLS